MNYNSYACDISYLCLANIGVIYYLFNEWLRLMFVRRKISWLFIFDSLSTDLIAV